MQLDQPPSSPLPPNQPSTSQSQESTKTSPITAVSNSQTNPPVNSASVSQSPWSLTAMGQSSSGASGGRPTGSQRPAVQPPKKIAAATIPSSQVQQKLTVKSASKPSTTKAPSSQSAVSAAKVSQSLATVEPASQSAGSSPAALSDQSLHTATKSGQSTAQEKSPSETSRVPPSHLSPPTPSSGGLQSMHTSSSTASHNQLVTNVSTNQSLTGPGSQLNTTSSVFPPDGHRVDISLLARQAKESLKSSLRRISGRLLVTGLTSSSHLHNFQTPHMHTHTRKHTHLWNEQQENSLYLLPPPARPWVSVLPGLVGGHGWLARQALSPLSRWCYSPALVWCLAMRSGPEHCSECWQMAKIANTFWAFFFSFKF